MVYLDLTTAKWTGRGRGGPVLITFHWALVDGVAECVGMDIHGFIRAAGQGPLEPVPGSWRVRAIPASLPAKLPLAALMKESRKEQWLLRHAIAEEGAPAPAKVRRIAAAQLRAFEAEPRRPGGRSLFWTPELLREALETYRAAPPRQRMAAVQKRFGITKSATAKVLARARALDVKGGK